MTEALSNRPCAFLPSSRLLDAAQADRQQTGGRRPVFFFVGRFVPVKGVDILLDAMSLYVRSGGTGELVIRGGGPLEDEIKSRASRGELQGRVTVGGYTQTAEYVSCLRSADIVVIPSRQESVPLVYSDALQMGRPLIVSRVGDMGQLMEQHASGRSFPAEDCQALADAMLEFDTIDRGELESSIKEAAAQFSLDRAAQALVEHLMNNDHNGAGPTSHA